MLFLQAARDTGATTIGITGAGTSPLARASDHLLLTHARESRFRAGAMVSRIAQLALVDCLFIGAAQLRRDVAVDALERSAAATRALRGGSRSQAVSTASGAAAGSGDRSWIEPAVRRNTMIQLKMSTAAISSTAVRL